MSNYYQFMFQYFSIQNDLKHFRLTHVSIKIFHDGTMHSILQWSFANIRLMVKHLWFTRHRWFFVLLVDGQCFSASTKKQCFVKGSPNDLLRTVAKLVECDGHTMGNSFGGSVGACVARARSMFQHCVFRLRFVVIAFVAAVPFRCSSLVQWFILGGWELSVHSFDLMGLERV